MTRPPALHSSPHHPRHQAPRRRRRGIALLTTAGLCLPVVLSVAASSPASASWRDSWTKHRWVKPTKPPRHRPAPTSTTSTTAAPSPTSTTTSPTSTTTSPTSTTTSTTTTGTPTATSTDAPATGSRRADSAGAAPVGSAAYPVPAGAVVVSPTGDDAAAGTTAAPVRTVARALALAPSGGTVVLRGGTYHESVTVTKAVTIQNYPHEAAWFDGTVPVDGWVKDGTAWRKDGWTQRFDASVGYSKGDRDGTSAGWQWVNPAYPMAAHPDQLFVDGQQMRQVGSRDALKAGTFYLDEATSRLYLGSDPSGRDVRGTTLTRAIRSTAADTVLRGIGIRRYAPSIWHVGAVTLEQPRAVVEQVSILDSATIGLGVIAAKGVVRDSTIERAGLLGVHLATADGFQMLHSRVDDNDWEQFNSAPVSGGIKTVRTRGLVVKDSSISDNLGQGYWSDVSVYDTRILSSNIVGNKAAGVFLEISARGTVADNLITDNGGDGVKVNNTTTVTIANNTVVRNGRPLNLVQDPRTPANTSYGDDPRYPNDPEMTWKLGPVTVRDNVIGLTENGANCVLCVEDYSHQRTGAQMGISSNGNVFTRTAAGSPGWLTIWSRGTVNPNPAVYTTLADHQAGTGQDGRSIGYDTSVVAGDGSLADSVQDRRGSVAVGIASDVAAQVGRTAGEKWLGAWGR